MTTKPLSRAVAAPDHASERRKEDRHFICFGRPLYMTWLRQESLLATLVEVSRHGFRMSHQYRQFQVGQEVTVSFPWGKVKAKVAWNRIGRQHVQTGFAVVESCGQEMLCPK